jgi:hypothetical protein
MGILGSLLFLTTGQLLSLEGHTLKCPECKATQFRYVWFTGQLRRDPAYQCCSCGAAVSVRNGSMTKRRLTGIEKAHQKRRQRRQKKQP